MRTHLRPRGRRLLLLLPVLLALALTAACGDEAPTLADGGDGDDAAIGHPTGADALVLRVDREGGFLPVDLAFGQVPPVSVYGDGRVILEGPQIEIFPPPALPNLLQRQAGEEGLQALLGAAEDAGLLSEPPDYGQPPVADATTTVVTIHANGETYVHRAYALAEGDGVPVQDLTEEQQEAREALAGFVSSVLGPESVIPDEELGPEEPYVPEAFAVWAQPAPLDEPGRGDDVGEAGESDEAGERDEAGDAGEGDGPVDEGPEPTVERWPLPDLDLPAAAECLVVDGEAAEVLRQALLSANTLTRFEQAATIHEVATRPLLPDEEGCP